MPRFPVTPAPPVAAKLLRPAEVATILSVYVDTVHAWIRAGKHAAVVLPSGQKRVSVAEVERILGGRLDEAAAPRETAAERQRRSDRDHAAIKKAKTAR